MNDQERTEWVLNDEGLYRMQHTSRKNVKQFVRENRQLIEEVIGNVKENKRPAHYLAYPERPRF